jgi:hypothetical protein
VEWYEAYKNGKSLRDGYEKDWMTAKIRTTEQKPLLIKRSRGRTTVSWPL